MITTDMQFKDIYDSIIADKEKLDIRKLYFLPKAIRSFKKETKFPAYQLYDYVVPKTQNKYIILFCAENRKAIENPKVRSLCIVYSGNKKYFINCMAGAHKLTPDSPLKLVRQLHVYTKHFLERYNERFLKCQALSEDEIACRFIFRNGDSLMPIILNEKINRNIKKYGGAGERGFKVRDGLCFLQSACEGRITEDGDRSNDRIDAICFIYATFMNKDEMAKEQLEGISEEHLERWTKSLEYFENEAKDGVLSLTLEP